MILVWRRGSYVLHFLKRKKKEIFVDKTKKSFQFCVILGSCNSLIDFDPL